MKAQFEKVTPGGSSFLTFERVDSEFLFRWHYHPEFELTLITDSYGQRLVGDGISDYGPGDLVLLGPNLPHSYRSGPPRPRAPKLHRAVVVQFRREFLGEALFDVEEMRPIARLLKRSECGLAFSNTKMGKAVAPRIAKFPSLSPSRRVIELLSALLDLSAEAHPQVLSTSLIPPICRVEDQQRIDAVCAYLNRHFDHEIDYAELSRIIHMDHASLCRFFKRATGRTMTAYVNQLRVGAAAHLLTDTDMSILEVGFRVGFGNYSNFNRQFKRIKGYVPRAVRQHFHSGAPEPQSLVHSAKRKSTRPSTPAKTRSKSKA